MGAPVDRALLPAADAGWPPADAREEAPSRASWSLRGRLLALVLALTAAAGLVGGVVSMRAAKEVAAHMRDQRLLQLSETVHAFARHELAEAAFAAPPTAGDPHEPEADQRPSLDLRYRYQVWRQGQLLLHSPDAPADKTLTGTLQPGFGDAQQDGRRLRGHVSAPDSAGLQVQVAELLDPAEVGLALPDLRMLALMLLSLVAVGALAALLLMRALRPVAETESTLRRRSPGELAPVPVQGLPDEMRPLIEAFNDQLARASERLSREQGFTALAAHELRTPLAALRMQVQVALRATDAAAREAQLNAALASADRSSHLIDQMLTLARIEQGSGGTRLSVDLRELCVRVGDDLAPEQTRRGVTLVVSGAPLRVTGWAFGLEVMVRNLLVNALRHAPQGKAVGIELHGGPDGTALCVDDAGSGIPPGDRQRVFERFVRLDRSGRTPGVGLGLAIVRAVADAHGAHVELLNSPLGGLRVRVLFRAAAGPADSPAPAP